MIAGIVNADFEATIALAICGFAGKIYTQDSIFDTGFSGWLSLPADLIEQLNLKWKRREFAILGDGSECVFNVYEAAVIWNADYLTIPMTKLIKNPLLKCH